MSASAGNRREGWELDESKLADVCLKRTIRHLKRKVSDAQKRAESGRVWDTVRLAQIGSRGLPLQDVHPMAAYLVKHWLGDKGEYQMWLNALGGKYVELKRVASRVKGKDTECYFSVERVREGYGHWEASGRFKFDKDPASQESEWHQPLFFMPPLCFFTADALETFVALVLDANERERSAWPYRTRLSENGCPGLTGNGRAAHDNGLSVNPGGRRKSEAVFPL